MTKAAILVGDKLHPDARHTLKFTIRMNTPDTVAILPHLNVIIYLTEFR